MKFCKTKDLTIESEILKVLLLINHREHGEHREPHFIFTLCSLCPCGFIIPRIRNLGINNTKGNN